MPADRYLEGMFEKFRYFATWLPNAPIELGDVGVLDGRRFQRVTSLKDLGIAFEVRKGTQPADLAHTSDSGVSIKLNASAEAGAVGASGAVNTALPHVKGSAVVDLAQQGAFVFQAKGCVERAIEDKARLGRDVLAAYRERADWDPAWVVIDTIVEAKSATIVVSSSASARLELSADAPLPAGGVALAEADAGLHVTAQSGDITHFVAQRGLKPMFQASRIRRGVVAWITRTLGGKDSFEIVKSGAGDEPEADAVAPSDDGENVLEPVQSE